MKHDLGPVVMVGSKMVLFEDTLWAAFVPTFPVGLDLVLFPYPTHFNPEDRGSIFLENIGICLQDYIVSQHRR
jgi:hypothetical protein